MENRTRSFAQNDRFAAHVGIELLEVSEGYAKACLTVCPHHLNGAGMLHGAAIFTLADLAPLLMCIWKKIQIKICYLCLYSTRVR